MSSIITLRLQDTSRQVLGLSSYLSEMPVSKLLNPFISDGISTVLGGLILHHIDRKLMFRRDTFESFTDMLLRNSAEPWGNSLTGAENRERLPRILFDFFELLSELKAVNRFNAALEGVTLEMDASYLDPQYIRALCRSLGEAYISSGASLERLDYHKASELFFHLMVVGFYRANAKGTAKALTTQLYAHGDLIEDLSKELKELYSERTKAGVVEAIVVTGGTKRRGRPPKKIAPLTSGEGRSVQGKAA